MRKFYLAVFATVAAVAVAQATQYSCLSIITETKKIGKWQSLKSWIEGAGLKDEWEKCAYVSDEYPQYAAVTNALVTAGVLDEDELRVLLVAAKDTAVPDRLLSRVYSNDVATASGRVKWHGKLVRQEIDTNRWVRVNFYEDGTSFTDKAAKPPEKIERVKRTVVAMTNGVPARLAAARQRWAEAKNSGNEITTNLTVRAGQ